MKSRTLDMMQDAGKLVGVLLAIGVVVGLLLFHVWNRYQITELGYAIADVTHEHRRLLEENKKLSIEVTVQGRTERMSTLGAERFGLRPMQPEQVRVIDPQDLDLAKGPEAHASLKF